MLNPMGIKAGTVMSGQASLPTALPKGFANLPSGSLTSGVVVGREGTGHLLLRTVGGMALVASSMKLARGTVVNLRIRGGAGSGATPSLSIESVAARPGLSAAPQATFPIGLEVELNEALTLLGKGDTGLTPSGLAPSGLTPSGLAVPGDKLAGALLFFLAAVNRGDFSAWFGAEAIRALKAQGRGDLLSRLSEIFGHQSRLAESPGEWQALFVPLHDGERVRQLRFFYRRPRDSESDCDGDRDSRFIVEIESSRLGGLQLDGLIKAMRFDLVMRSHRPLPDPARHDISEIFTEGLAITGQSGGIAFQTVDHFPVAPMESMAGRANQGFLA